MVAADAGIRETVKRAILPLVPLSLLTACSAAWAASDARDIVRQSIGRRDLQIDMPAEIARPRALARLAEVRPVAGDDPDHALGRRHSRCPGDDLVAARQPADLQPITQDRGTRGDAPRLQPVEPDEDAEIEADDLARQGHYGEAMHVLLLKSLAEIRTRLGVSFAASLTSREIVRRVQLPQTGRGALVAIVQSVERTYYGGRPASREDYSGCREEFDMS